jgi:hypothetical protein
MSTPDLHALARIKLVELRRQRLALGARYDELEAIALQRDRSLLGRIDDLLAGLGGMRFAQTQLHPAVAQIQAELGLLREEATAGRGDEELLQRALHRLHRELTQGRTRVEIAQLFGELIEEHLAMPAAPAPPIDETILSILTSPAPAVEVHSWFDRLLAEHPGACQQLREVLSEEKNSLVRIPDNHMVAELLKSIARGPWQLQERRDAATSILGSPSTIGEYTDVLRILLERIDDWHWPASGVPVHVEWDHGKFRMSLDEDLLDCLLTEHIGSELAAAVLAWREDVGGSSPHRLGHNLFTPPAPPWGDATQDTAVMRRYFRDVSLFHLDQRLADSSNKLACAPLSNATEGYGRGATNLDRETHQELLFVTLQSQITARRALCPEAPLWVLHFDLQNFFPSVSHEATLAALDHLGLARRWQSLVARFLAVPGRLAGREIPVVRGIFASRLLAWLIAELLLLPLETAIHDATGLRLIRTVDDVFVIASNHDQIDQIWLIAQSFTRAFGLAIHPTKSGLVCLAPGGPPPAPLAADPQESSAPHAAPLPTTPPRWGALQREADGQWHPNETKLESLRAWTQSQMQEARSVLEAVNRINTETLYLVRSLALVAPLPMSHIEALAPHVARFHQDLFQPGHGVREELLRRAQNDLRSGPGGRDALPSYLLHWPITAGGLGVLNPLVFVHSLRVARAGLAPATAPQERTEAEYGERLAAFHQQEAERAATRRDELDPAQYLARWRKHLTTLDLHSSGWPRHLEACAQRLPLAGPPSTPMLEALVADFIDRGTEVSGQAQPGLSPYWRWVLYTYGPALLDAVGSFRFLLTELVPVPVLGRRGRSAPEG